MLGHVLEFLYQLALDALGLMLAVFCGALQPAPPAPPAEPETAHRSAAVEVRQPCSGDHGSDAASRLTRAIAVA